MRSWCLCFAKPPSQNPYYRVHTTELLYLWAGDISFLTQLRTISTMQSSLPHTKACLGASNLQAKISNAVPEAGSHPSRALGEAREWIHHKPECQSWPGCVPTHDTPGHANEMFLVATQSKSLQAQRTIL